MLFRSRAALLTRLVLQPEELNSTANNSIPQFTLNIQGDQFMAMGKHLECEQTRSRREGLQPSLAPYPRLGAPDTTGRARRSANNNTQTVPVT
jgi:hypothetical protein